MPRLAIQTENYPLFCFDRAQRFGYRVLEGLMNRDRAVGLALILTAVFAVMVVGALTGRVGSAVLTALGILVVSAAAGFFGEWLVRRR